MLLIRWIRFMRGTVTFQIEGDFAERFLNLISKNGIPVFQTRYRDGVFYATTAAKSYHRIRPFVRATHVRVRVAERHGFPFVARKYFRRFGLFAGILMFLVCLGISGQFVWEIQVRGNHAVSTDAIIQTLQEEGLTRGRWKKSLNPQMLAMKLRLKHHEISWAAINLVGSVAEVEVNERIEIGELPEEQTPCNVVAARGGQIVSIQVYDGQKVRQKGEAVRQGELIVSGVVKSLAKGKTILRHASASVMAEYPEHNQITVPLTQTLKVPQGGVQNYRYLNLGSLRLPLFLARERGQEESFERVFTRPMRVCGIPLPFDVTILQVIPAKMETVSITPEKARELALSQMSAYEKKNPKRTVVARKIRQQTTNQQIIFDIDYTFCEDIARQEPILLNHSDGNGK